MLAHVGLCWGYVGLRWPRAGSKMAQDRFMLAQVGSKMPKKAPKDLPSTSRWGQNSSKMASKSICFGFMVIFSKFWKSGSRCSQGHFFQDLHPLILSILGTSWNKILFILVYAVLYASRCLQVASNLLQICFLEFILSQIDPKLAPSCLMLDPSWSQVGSKLAQVEAKCGVVWCGSLCKLTLKVRKCKQNVSLL